jgi:hypothetical protein
MKVIDSPSNDRSEATFMRKRMSDGSAYDDMGSVDQNYDADR